MIRLLTATTAALAVVLTGPAAVAGTDEPTAPYNEQVVLMNESNAQPEEQSRINGTAPVTSSDGSSVVFSTAAALVPWDTNETEDVYLRSDGITILVSRAGDDAGDDASFEPTISADGRWVAFSTFATDLAPGTAGPSLDVVVRDMHSSRITLVSRTSDGRTGSRNDFFPVMSADGRHVAFQSFSRLGARDGDRLEDVYVHDLATRRTRQVSLLPGGGADLPDAVVVGGISANGRLVTFGNERKLWVRDVVARSTSRFHREPGTAPCNEGHAGSAGRPAISANGRWLAFASCAVSLVGPEGHADVFRVDRRTGEMERLTFGDDDTFLPSLSDSGRFVSFGSAATNLVPGDVQGQLDAFRLDTTTGEIVRISVAPDGSGGNNKSAGDAVAISGDGHTVVYPSYADNLIPGDVYDLVEVFTWRAG